MDRPPSSVPYGRLEEQPAIGPPPSYKFWSIVNILCCCLPLGVVALIYSGRVEECLARRDTAGAKSASNTARTINILALVIGLVAIGVVLFLMILRVQLIKLSPAPTTHSPLYYNLG